MSVSFDDVFASIFLFCTCVIFCLAQVHIENSEVARCLFYLFIYSNDRVQLISNCNGRLKSLHVTSLLFVYGGVCLHRTLPAVDRAAPCSQKRKTDSALFSSFLRLYDISPDSS